MLGFPVIFQAFRRREQFIAGLAVVMAATLDIMFLQTNPFGKVLVTLPANVVKARVLFMLPKSAIVRKVTITTIAIRHC